MSFIKTFSGKHFYYDRINKDDIDINDIAVSLSNICRFAGHLSHFYSVAQHAVLCTGLMMALSGLYWKVSRQQRCST
ncbi:hypothetical protein HIM76_25195 [Salmonella enterica subsp. enterica serovar Typhimurium]|nr:hypothetical protein [Salmonella enterica subsp. enterica serovar Typhimurium]